MGKIARSGDTSGSRLTREGRTPIAARGADGARSRAYSVIGDSSSSRAAANPGGMVIETDEELIAGVGRGDWRALERLLTRYEGPLFRFFYRLGCRAGWCEDLVQTVMIRVYEQCARYDASRRFAPWLYGIARNVWREHIRQQVRDRAEPLEEDSGDAGTGDATDPLERAEVAEEIHLVRRALLRLPQEERLTLVLRHWHGLTYAEIAETLDVPLGTVKWRIHDAHRKLAAWFAVEGRWRDWEVRG